MKDDTCQKSSPWSMPDYPMYECAFRGCPNTVTYNPLVYPTLKAQIKDLLTEGEWRKIKGKFYCPDHTRLAIKIDRLEAQILGDEDE